MYIYQIMSNSFGYLDIILLGMIAGFIILRLRSILGRKTGHESKVYPGFTEKEFRKLASCFGINLPCPILMFEFLVVLQNKCRVSP